MELQVGKATPIEIPEECKTLYEKVCHLRKLGYVFDDFEEGDDAAWLYGDNIEYIDGIFYAIETQNFEECGGSTATKNKDGTYDFVCYWYNGGAGFGEVLESAMKSATIND